MNRKLFENDTITCLTKKASQFHSGSVGSLDLFGRGSRIIGYLDNIDHVIRLQRLLGLKKVSFEAFISSYSHPSTYYL